MTSPRGRVLRAPEAVLAGLFCAVLGWSAHALLTAPGRPPLDRIGVAFDSDPSLPLDGPDSLRFAGEPASGPVRGERRRLTDDAAQLVVEDRDLEFLRAFGRVELLFERGPDGEIDVRATLYPPYGPPYVERRARPAITGPWGRVTASVPIDALFDLRPCAIAFDLGFEGYRVEGRVRLAAGE